MIKIRIVCVGKLKEAYWRDACAEYLKRLSKFCKTELLELPERAGLEEEGADILRQLRGDVIVLAIEGKGCSSEEFSADLRRRFDAGREVTFVIGSSCGLDGAVKRRASSLLSFSQMTFPHQMMRVVLLEQIYRAFMIMSGSEYHK